MNDLERQLMAAEADLYQTLTSARYPFFNEHATDLSFVNDPAYHEHRVALYNALMSNAKFLESTAHLLDSVTRAHGLPSLC